MKTLKIEEKTMENLKELKLKTKSKTYSETLEVIFKVNEILAELIKYDQSKK